MPNDPFANYRLGIIYAEKFNQQNQLGLLAAAKSHFTAVIAANPDTNEADRSRKMLKNIDSALAQVR
jgi:hypothetical protein